ncbi:hypothetical protein QCA50_019037 [Cerrena zonata]|uniref:t-SNARE coiled-coil homology domain-containing protein n=1 Tax=Cerrena zonata TaxID=2478898 RepID=A0AAW0FKU5_9APHY
MAELTQLFHDMEELVIEQDQPIQQIDEQVGAAQHDLEQGVGHTDKAVKSAKSARKKKFAIIAGYFGSKKLIKVNSSISLRSIVYYQWSNSLSVLPWPLKPWCAGVLLPPLEPTGLPYAWTCLNYQDNPVTIPHNQTIPF